MTGADGRAVQIALVVACAVTALWLVQDARDQRSVRTAVERANAGDLDGAIELARTVEGRPAAARARIIEARAAAAAGRPAEAVAAFLQAAEYAPADHALHAEWALAELARGRRSAARSHMQRALALNPRIRLPAQFVLAAP